MMGNKMISTWDMMSGEVEYPCTNESISAVITGLDLKKDDIIISVAGSGDMPFAIAPYVKKVYAVDSNIAQIEFMERRKGFLKKGDFSSFYFESAMMACSDFDLSVGFPGRDFSVGHLVARKDYFGSKTDDVIRSLDKIESHCSDIFNFIEGFPLGSIDKIYLSNTLFWADTYGRRKLGRVSSRVREGGLIYDTLKKGNWRGSHSKKLQVNKKRTSEARKIEAKEAISRYLWFPIVYEKIK